MSAESILQSNIRKYLKSKGCYVLVIQPTPSVPKGCPDIIFMLEGFWGSIEVKAAPGSPYQPLQEETIAKHNEWSWSRRVDPTTWPDVKTELEGIL